MDQNEKKAKTSEVCYTLYIYCVIDDEHIYASIIETEISNTALVQGSFLYYSLKRFSTRTELNSLTRM